MVLKLYSVGKIMYASRYQPGSILTVLVYSNILRSCCLLDLVTCHQHQNERKVREFH